MTDGAPTPPGASQGPPPPSGRSGGRNALLAGLALLVVLAVVGVGLLLALGGDDDAVAPEEYAEDVCTSVADWEDELQEEAAGLDDELADSEPEEIKERFTSFLEGAERRTNQLLDEVDDVGDPEGEDGEALAGDLRAGLAEARDLFRTAAEDARALDVGDQEAFVAGVRQVGEELTEGGEQVERTFDDLEQAYEDGDLADAFEDVEACEDLGGA
ncbi:MAG: hypothetical protein H0U89_09595 [Acidimicrobiia bacterium]|nr:hypothetical protein [Acidimicrobiia bacterium]